MIIVENVTKKYGHTKVLDDISFEIDGGDFVSIVGPSGAGKTTVIHALMGATDISNGKIIMDGVDISKLNPAEVQKYRKRIGIVFQDYKLLPQKTVFENVSFALEVNGYDKSFINHRTTEVLRLTGLEEQRNHFPRQLSGGERQRTAMARALVHAPDLLLADEPTGNLDPNTAMAIAKLLVKINEGGTTVILATHNKDVVNSIKKRVIALDKGRVVSDRKESGYNI